MKEEKNSDPVVSLEKNLQDLQDLVARVGDEKLPLPKIYHYYQQAIKLMAECESQLQEFELKLSVLENPEEVAQGQDPQMSPLSWEPTEGIFTPSESSSEKPKS